MRAQILGLIVGILAGVSQVQADPMLTGIPELDDLLRNAIRRQGSEDMERVEIGNTTDRADQYDSVNGRLADALHSNNRDEIAWFTPPILRMLLMAGETPVSYHWCEQLDTSVPVKDDAVHSSMRWTIEKELQKHMPSRYDDQEERIVELEKLVKTLHVTNAKKTRDWKMDHY